MKTILKIILITSLYFMSVQAAVSIERCRENYNKANSNIKKGNYESDVKKRQKYYKAAIENYTDAQFTCSNIFYNELEGYIRQIQYSIKNLTPKTEEELKKIKKSSSKYKRAEANRKAKEANEAMYNNLKSKSINNQTFNEDLNTKYNANINKKPIYNDYKGQPELKIDNLHIFGITSIKEFKKTKVIINSVSGTFALPKDKFKSANKINFTEDLMK